MRFIVNTINTGITGEVYGHLVKIQTTQTVTIRLKSVRKRKHSTARCTESRVKNKINEGWAGTLQCTQHRQGHLLTSHPLMTAACSGSFLQWGSMHCKCKAYRKLNKLDCLYCNSKTGNNTTDWQVLQHGKSLILIQKLYPGVDWGCSSGPHLVTTSSSSDSDNGHKENRTVNGISQVIRI